MYQVSEAYKTAIAKESREFYYDAVLKTNDGTEIRVSEEQIIKGSATIAWQCCGGEEIEIGSVYTTELSISLKINTDRYALMGGTIKPVFHLKLADGSYEPVPLGVYEISEPDRRISCIDITAYDNMAKFETGFSLGQTSGTPYDLLLAACTACGVELGHSQQEIQNMPNGKRTLSLYEENDIETWRDFLHYISQALGGFAAIDRGGRLVIRHFGAAATKQVPAELRFTSSFSDYVTRYTGLKHTNNQNSKIEYVYTEPDDGLTMTLEANPLLQQGHEPDREAMLREILGALVAVRYVPFDSEAVEDPALDLGDVLSFTGNHADGSIACITHNTLKFNGRQSLQCVGKNPRLMGAKSKTDKQLANLQNSVNGSSMTLYHYTNGKIINIGQTKIEAAVIQFVTTKETNAEFKAVMLLEVAAAGTLTVTYVLYDAEITDFVPMQILTPGRHMINLYYPLIDIPTDKVGTLRVVLSMDTGNAVIDRGGLRATIVGQGFAASEGKWDGNIQVEQVFGLVPCGVFWVGFSDKVRVEQDTPHVRALTDTVGILNPGISFVGFTADIEEPEFIIRSQTMKAFDMASFAGNQYVLYDGETTGLQTAYQYVSKVQPIDTGYLCKVTVNTEQFKRVDRIEVEHGSET